MSYIFNALGSLFFLPMAWLGCIFAPFDNFTFTDAADFAPIALIVITTSGIIYRHFKKPYPKVWLTAATASAFLLAIFPPLLFLGSLYVLSFRGLAVIGHWPQAMIDDPQFIVNRDLDFKRLSGVCAYTEAFTGWGLIAFAALALHLRESLSVRHKYWLAAVFVISWLIFACEPGQRFAWWLD